KYILTAMKMHFDQNQLSLEEIENQLKQEIDKYRFTPERVLMKQLELGGLWRVAAAVVLLVGLYFLIQWINRPYDTYTTRYGDRMTIQFPDESIIQLNSNSTLTWSRDWEKEAERMVNIEGEAFFDVHHLVW